jgi:hypothetical protein
MMSEKKPAPCLSQPMIACKHSQEEYLDRLLAACEYYEINPSDPDLLKKLLMVLLQDRWAGFRIRRPGGADAQT